MSEPDTPAKDQHSNPEFDVHKYIVDENGDLVLDDQGNPMPMSMQYHLINLDNSDQFC